MENSLKHQLVTSHQFLYSLDPSTLLPIELAAPLLNKSAATLRTDVTRRPQSLPVFVRFGRRVFFIKKDIDAFIQASRCAQFVQPSPVAVPAPAPKKRGRPSNASKVARLTGGVSHV